jgi:hypothetical protein
MSFISGQTWRVPYVVERVAVVCGNRPGASGARSKVPVLIQCFVVPRLADMQRLSNRRYPTESQSAEQNYNRCKLPLATGFCFHHTINSEMANREDGSRDSGTVVIVGDRAQLKGYLLLGFEPIV